VPKLVGLTLRQAKGKITEAGLKLGAVSGPSPTDDGIVAALEPRPEAEVPLGTPINLKVRPPRVARGSNGSTA
jgi:beta-lactam-binding protein with PASTA domain